MDPVHKRTAGCARDRLVAVRRALDAAQDASAHRPSDVTVQVALLGWLVSQIFKRLKTLGQEDADVHIRHHQRGTLDALPDLFKGVSVDILPKCGP